MSVSRRSLTRAIAASAGAVALAGTGAGTASAAGRPASAKSPAQQGGSTAPGPTIKHTRKGPTGYEVTFRYHAPKASRVQVKGEWYLERPLELAQRLTTPDQVVESQGLLPRQWESGDVPISHPNSTNPNWPVADMKKGRDGVWTYTTPLPAGVFTYGFFVDADAEDSTTEGQLADPGNPAWNMRDGRVLGTAVDRSQIYVPGDPDFGARDLSWQGPVSGRRGELHHVTYDSPGHVTPADENYLVVYTPPGYDAKRRQPYPTLYLSHGGGDDEMAWSTQGAVADILDHLVTDGEVEPMVVVMPNANGYAASTDEALHRTDLITRVFPWVEKHYNVSAEASRRAYSGLSSGGIRTVYLLRDNTEQFGYYGVMSAGLPSGTTFPPALVTALKKVSVFVGGGWQDPINQGYLTYHRGPLRAIRDLTAAGVHVQSDFVDGGHEWYVWRILLKDFLTRTAFLPQAVAPADWGV